MGSLTINTSAAQDTRIAAAFGHGLGLVNASGNPRSATGPEVKAEFIQQVIRYVRHQEQHMADLAAAFAEKAKEDPISPQ